MIGRLAGTLLEKNPPQLLVDCHGVGYEVSVPMSTFYNLPSLGGQVVLLTHLAVREDAQILYGFNSAEERHAFRELIKVSGVGARLALSILSSMSVAELMQTVIKQEAGRLNSVPGIGKKTAARLLLELKGKFGAKLGDIAAHPIAADIINALLALGYSDREVALALQQVSPDAAVAEGIKQALKILSKTAP